jgi:hypothetical protein
MGISLFPIPPSEFPLKNALQKSPDRMTLENDVRLTPSIIDFEENQIDVGNQIYQKYTYHYSQGIKHIVNCRRHNYPHTWLRRVWL